MVSSRTLTALTGLVISLVVSVLLFWYTNSIVVFLFVPFVPFLFRGLARTGDRDHRRTYQECPECGYRTADPDHEYCPRDGRRLEPRESGRADRGDRR